MAKQLMRYFGVIIVFMVGLSGAASADIQQARVLLDKMSHSFRELNYQGAFSYQQGDVTQSFRITHAVIGGEEYERLEYMDGEKREIIRRGHTLECIHPGHRLVRLYQQHQELKQSASYLETNPSDLSDYYELSVLDQGRIAGREVVELLVSPKDTHRFIHRLSLDKQTGLLLRLVVEGTAGKMLERFQFAEIQIGGDISTDSFKDTDHSYQATHVDPALSFSPDNASKITSKRPWLVNWLPGGFTTVVANQKVALDDMVTFTDGFAVFSVFLEKLDQSQLENQTNDSSEGYARRGATAAYSRPLLLSGTPHRVTIVGEIPKQTARQVAQSIALVQP